VVLDGGVVMYYMIHATDHPHGPALMSRAYRSTVLPLEPPEQLKLELQPVSAEGTELPAGSP